VGADHVFEAVGKRALQSAAIDYCCSGGTVTFVGLESEDATINLKTTAITRAEKTISGSIYGSACTDKDFLLYGEKFLDGDLPVDQLVNRRYQLKEINIALSDMRKGKPGRGVILFDN
jgi:Zn-dependent alcohol dehydrogenase